MSIRRVLFGSTIIAGFAALSVSTAWAQDPAGDPAAQQPPAPEDPGTAPVAVDQDEEVESVVVTGSRIRLPDYTQSAPITSVSAEAIQRSGSTNLTEFLRDVPALTSSFGNQEGADVSFGGLAGLNLLDLRNLGTQRTLVLVNGRRHVASNGGSGAVDINTIPISLVERVEVLTGGASATYGADAVSGVVNFVLKDDFEGVDVRTQYGWTDAGGGEDAFVSVLLGDNFHEGRGNVTLNAEFGSIGSVGRDQREYSRLGNRRIYVQNPNDLDDDPNLPDFIISGDVRYPDTSPYGSVYTDLDFDDAIFGIDWQGDGQPWRSGQPTAGFFVIGGSGSLTDEFEDELLPALDRQSVNGTFRYDLTPKLRFFAEAKAVRTQTNFQSQPTYDFGYGDFTFTGFYVPLDNAFMPENIRADAAAAAARGDNIASDGFGLDPGVFVLRDNLDLGYTNYDIERETYRTVFGFSGEITENLDYEVSYVWGRTDEQNIYTGNRINERWFAAIDSVIGPNGQPVCRSDLDPTAIPVNADPRTFGTTFTPGANSGCVPADIFGRDVSAAARDWINTESERNSRIGQQVLTAFVQGRTTPFELPAGPIGYAAGFEFRKETFRYRTSEEERTAVEQAESAAADGEELLYDLTWLGQGNDSDGEYDVTELFGEVSVPILKDVRFARNLTVDGAYRFSDYSNSGSSQTWKVGGLWRINDDVMLRAAAARAVRAPNISDLFQPLTQTSDLLDDPCDADNYLAGTSFREDNCRAALAPFGLAPETFQNTNTGSVEGRTGGNQDLEPELADTFTAGFVLSPRFVSGLNFSVDYYDIKLENAIQLFDPQTIVDKCYDLPQPNSFCPLITRSDATGIGRGFIDFFQQVSLNVAAYETSGYDFTVRYRLDPADFGIRRDIGQFQFDLVGNKLEELTFIELADAEPDDDVGDAAVGDRTIAPEWQVVFDATWRFRDLTVNYGYSWFSQTLAFGVDEPNRFVIDPDYVEDRYYDERSQHDIQVRYDFDDRLGVYAGINNFTNQEPEEGFVDVPYVTHQGRFFYVGASARLGAVPRLRMPRF